MGRSFMATMIFLGLASPLLAQQPAHNFADMRVQPGQMVTVTTQSGNEIRGRVATVDATTLTLSVGDTTESISERDARRIDRDGDAPWEGMGIGLIAGGGFGLLGALACRLCEGREQAAGVLAFSAIGTGAGALIDLMIRGKTRVFEAPGTGAVRVRVIPSVAADRKAILVSIGL
jgi:hypothetical protein